MDSDVACAVQAIIHRTTNTKQMFITPIWPITTLAGKRDLAFAAFIILGPRNDEPSPAKVKEIERIAMINA